MFEIDRVILDKSVGIVSIVILLWFFLYMIYVFIKDGINFIKKNNIFEFIKKTICEILLAFILILIVMGIPVIIIYFVLKYLI